MQLPLVTDWPFFRRGTNPSERLYSGLDRKNGGQDMEEKLAVHRKQALFSQKAAL